MTSPAPREKRGWLKKIKNVIGRKEISSAIDRANSEIVEAVSHFNVSIPAPFYVRISPETTMSLKRPKAKSR
jgi:hypothetical protein